MAVTVPDIKNAFPEFVSPTNAGAVDALITIKLASAEAQIDRTIFVSTTQADEAVKLLCAHLLAMSPSGINARLMPSTGPNAGSTIYWPRYRAIVCGAVAGFRVP